MKLFKKLTYCLLAVISINNVVNANDQQYNIEEVKKSIIKAILLEVDPNYLHKEHSGNEKWFHPSFYNQTQPIANILDILDESSQVIPHGAHRITVDGDKVAKVTGVFIDDIPGYGVVIYDRKITTQPKRFTTQIIDGDEYLHTNALLPTQYNQHIIIFDCLIPNIGTCEVPGRFIKKFSARNLSHVNRYKYVKQHTNPLTYYQHTHLNTLIYDQNKRPTNLVKNNRKFSFFNN